MKLHVLQQECSRLPTHFTKHSIILLTLPFRILSPSYSFVAGNEAEKFVFDAQESRKQNKNTMQKRAEEYITKKKVKPFFITIRELGVFLTSYKILFTGKKALF
jgi:hypothetical protein